MQGIPQGATPNLQLLLSLLANTIIASLDPLPKQFIYLIHWQ